MKIKLIEFKNQNNITLRGILTISDDQPVAGAIFLQGFERNATVEKKFRQMAASLAAQNVVSLRYDASGCGLSDGDFAKTTIRSRAQELLSAVSIFKRKYGDLKINFVAHSLGACALALALDEVKPVIGKIVFIAPALNQKNLLRFYFVRDAMNKLNSEFKISWTNYKQYLDEELFEKDCRRIDKIARENYIGPDYFLEAKDLDFSRSFDTIKEKILHVHGDCDMSVPLESVGIKFARRIIVKGGDHDLERPDFWQQWFPKAVDF